MPVLDQWLDTGTQARGRGRQLPRTRTARSFRGPDIYTTPGPCRDNYPLHGDPRTAAGAPLRNDILKCQLKPAATSDYK